MCKEGRELLLGFLCMSKPPRLFCSQPPVPLTWSVLLTSLLSFPLHSVMMTVMGMYEATVKNMMMAMVGSMACQRGGGDRHS